MDGSASSDLDTPVPDPDPAPEGLPNIADYWPDAPHRMGPAADWYPDQAEPAGAASPPYTQEPQPTQLISPPPRARRRGLRVLLAALAVLVFVGGSALALARLVLRPAPSPPAGVTAQPATQQPDGAVPDQPNAPVSVQPAPSATVAPSAAVSATPTATALPFTSGTFELSGNVIELNVSIADLGNEPVRFSTPAGSGLKPQLSRDGGTVKLDPKPDGSEGNGRVDVQLNGKVTWSIRMGGGVTRGNFALTGAKLRRIDLVGGASRIAMTLPTPGETMPIKMYGGVNNWQITTADKVPLKVLLRDGAGKVTLNGKTSNGLKRNAQLNVDGGDGVESGGFGIDAVGGIGTLTVAPD
ncbi:hypothetical protein [Actinoplanes sp. NPDC026619]|uniref:hypothetical protein n=1 Tax=Actinoplanes sp. NPDC026619 TaxID=3155798 RepID=UPI0033F25C72